MELVWCCHRFVVLVIGTVVYGRGDEQHVESHKETIQSTHPHLRWRGSPPAYLPTYPAGATTLPSANSL